MDYDLDTAMADMVQDEETLQEVACDVINDDRFHDSIVAAVISSDGEMFVKICEEMARDLALYFRDRQDARKTHL